MNSFSGDSPPGPELFLPLKPVFATAREETRPERQKRAGMGMQKFSCFQTRLRARGVSYPEIIITTLECQRETPAEPTETLATARVV